MLRNQRLQLDDKPGVQAESQIRVDAILERRQPQLFEPGRLHRDKWRVTNIVQRWAAPQSAVPRAGRRPTAPTVQLARAITKRSNRSASIASGSRSSK